MQIVIDIPDEDVPNKQDIIDINLHFIAGEVCECSYPYTVLPKGHGRLIDVDAFIATMEDASKRQKYKELLIDDILTVDDVFKAIIESLQNKGLAEGDSPTIIEADGGDAE